MIVEVIFLPQRICKKCYISLSTRCVTQAGHLEVTTDVNSLSVLLELQQLIARQGIPRLLVSDHFKIFKSLDVKILELSRNILESYFRALTLVGRILREIDCNN